MDAAVQRTVAHLQQDTVRIAVAGAVRAGGRVEFDVEIQNLTGHKFPTAYPSRRAWLQVTTFADAAGRVVFESGAFAPDGRVAGNDNDEDAARFEPHYARIDRADQVQVYESVMADAAGTRDDRPALRRAVREGQPPAAARVQQGEPRRPTVAVHGDAAADADFIGGGDRVRYSVDAGSTAAGPFTITAKLWFQPIGYRWAVNLRGYDAPEPRRFVRY